MTVEKENQFWLKYIVIPIEVLMNEKLTSAEMKLFGLIDILDGAGGCYARNEYMAAILNLSITAVSTGVSKLKEQGYVKQESFDGRVRVIRIDPAYKQTYSQTLSRLKGRIKAGLKGNNKGKKERKTLSLSLQDKDNSEPAVRPHSKRPLLNTSYSNRPAKSDIQMPEQRLPKKQLAYENASPEARSIVVSWNRLPTTSSHRKGSKSVRKILRLLDDGLLKKHSVKEIQRSMEDFGMMQQNAVLYKVPVARTSIDDFFVGNGFVAGVRKHKGLAVEPPWFDRLILPGSFGNYLRVEDANRGLTKEFKRLYEKHVAGEAPEFYTPKQEGQFAKASSLLKRCIERGRFGRCVDGAGVVDYILHFLRALDEEWGASKIRVWHLSAVDSWNSVFPRYMTRHWREVS